MRNMFCIFAFIQPTKTFVTSFQFFLRKMISVSSNSFAGFAHFSLFMAGFTAFRYWHQRFRNIVVQELWIYPIKSAKGIKMSAVQICRRGFKWDREFMLVDSKGKFVSQRSNPKMALIECSIDYSYNILRCNAPQMETLELSLENFSGESVTVNVWGDLCDAIDIGMGGWFERFLGVSSLRLVRMAPSFKRQTDIEYAPRGQTSFSDGYPFLLSSSESIDDVNARLSVLGLSQISSENFRPNIIVTGASVPFAEDLWKDLCFLNPSGPVEMSIVKPCARCTVPVVDPEKGEFYADKAGINKLIQSFRSGAKIGLTKEKWHREVFFGQNVDHRSRDDGWISVGDVVRIDSRL